MEKHRRMREVRSEEIGFFLGAHGQHDVECVSLTDCLLVCRCPRCPLRSTCADFP